jgi:thiamine biosynthesis lipoprotein
MAGQAAMAASGTQDQALSVEMRSDGLMAVCFTAMASPCEVLLPWTTVAAALEVGRLVAREAWRVERKFSRYRADSITARIHESRGHGIEVDSETASLIDFASRCFDLSDGLFDVTSGVLRYAWKFDGSDRVPEPAAIERMLPLIGFSKLQWQSPHLMLPVEMELDFGGIGKEYAVDRAYELLAARDSGPVMNAHTPPKSAE